MPNKKSNSKIACMVAALALAGPTAALPAADFGSLQKTIKCLGASAYNGPYLAPIQWPKWATGLNGKFMHISDIHIDELYKEGTDPAGTMCHRPSATNAALNVAGKYGTLSSICDTPQVMLDATFDWIKKNTADVDFILYTGDSARHDRDKTVPRQHSEVLNEHKIVVDKVISAFDTSKTKFIPTFGNNDELDYNKMAPVTDPIIANLTQIWAPYKLGLDKNQDWLNGGYFAYEVKPGLVVLNLNSMLLFASNVLTKDCAVDGSAGAGMLTWLRNQLSQLRSAGQKAYVMQHIPPLDHSGKKLYYPTCHNDYTNILGSFSDVILGSFYGHTNKDYISYVYTNNTSSPQDGPFFISTVTDTVPSIDFDNTCILHVSSQGPSIIGENNPALRVYSYDTSRFGFGGLVKWTQYWSDLVKDNAEDKVAYDLEYTTQQAYGLWNLSPLSWTLALQDWAKNSSSYQDYLKYRFVQNPNPVLKG
ncbi:hypothetical protein SpCBS45565_g02346 [Spizellomyces sp. 'palustris']|nr:hypothetical protein SpCBS45565_g02346 [Spizellomyces sp. 'palustris']